jgi:hypothetical protein
MNSPMRWGGASIVVASVLLTVITAAHAPRLSYNGPSRYYELSIWNGAIGTAVWVKGPTSWTPPHAQGWRLAYENRGRNREWTWGFRAKAQTMRPPTPLVIYSLSVPLWSTLALGAAMGLYGWRRRHLTTHDQCPCGYDLAGLTPGSPCPECAAIHSRACHAGVPERG